MSQYVLQSLNLKTNAISKKNLAASGKDSIKAQFATQYLVIDLETGRAPRKLVLKKKAKNLSIEVDGAQVAEIKDFYDDSSNKVAPTYRIDDFCSLDDAQSIKKSNKEGRYELVVGGTGEHSAYTLADGIVWHENTALCLIPPANPALVGGAFGQMGMLGLVAALVGGGAALAGGGGGSGSSAPNATTPPSAPAVAIPEATNNVNATEAADGVQLTVTLPNNAVVGDIVTTVVSGPDGAAITLTHTLTAADIANHSIVQTVPLSTIHPNANFLYGNWTTSTTIADPAGNVSPAIADTFALVPIITINPITSDNLISATEALGTIPVTGTTTAEPGQTVTVTFNGQNFTATVQPDGTWSVNVPSNAIPAESLFKLLME